MFPRVSQRIRDQINFLRARSDLVSCDLLDAEPMAIGGGRTDGVAGGPVNVNVAILLFY